MAYIHPIDGGGGGGGGYDGGGLTLDSAGTTTFSLSSGEEAQLQADVTNSGSVGAAVTVAFKLGGETVATADDTVPANGTETAAETVTREELQDMGVSAGDYRLKAVLQSGPTWEEQTAESGTITVRPLPGDADDTDDGGLLSAVPSVAGLPGPVVAGVGGLLLLAVMFA